MTDEIDYIMEFEWRYRAVDVAKVCCVDWKINRTRNVVSRSILGTMRQVFNGAFDCIHADLCDNRSLIATNSRAGQNFLLVVARKTWTTFSPSRLGCNTQVRGKSFGWFNVETFRRDHRALRWKSIVWICAYLSSMLWNYDWRANLLHVDKQLWMWHNTVLNWRN